MSTWMEFDQPSPPRPPRGKPGARSGSLTEPWRCFNDRRGTGAQTFEQRLSRARLLFLRRDDNGANWLALAIAGAFLALPLLSRIAESATPSEQVSAASSPGDTCGVLANHGAVRMSTLEANR